MQASIFRSKAGFHVHNGCPKGFTLLEVMVALSMIAVVLTALFRMQSQSVLMTNRAKFYTIAPLLAEEKMADIDTGKASDRNMEGAGDFGSEFPGYTWRYTIAAVTSETLGEVAKRIKRIDVTITFNEEENYSLRSYRFWVDE